MKTHHPARHSTSTIAPARRPDGPRHSSDGMHAVQRRSLPHRLRAGIESLSGFAMDDVRVHYNSAEPAGLHALAYTQGTDIHVAPGQQKHLPHEAWHVAQQKQGRVKPTLQMNGVAINDDGALEREAERMGKRAATHGPRRGSTASIQRVTPVQLMEAVPRRKNKQVNKSADIREVLEGFVIESGYVFPNQESGDGCMGYLTCSQYVFRKVDETNQQLALHVTFDIKGIFIPANLDQKIRINIESLHLTARPQSTAKTISDAGASKLTAAESIHMSSGTKGWKFPAGKLDELARLLHLDRNVVEARVRHALRSDNVERLEGIGTEIVEALTRVLAAKEGTTPERVTVITSNW